MSSIIRLISCIIIYLVFDGFVICQSGALDQKFGINGIQEINFGYHTSANCSALQNGHKLVIGGSAIFGNNNLENAAVFRLNSNGVVDSSFGQNGVFYSKNIYGSITKIKVLEDGKIICTSLYTKILNNGSLQGVLNIFRLNSNGLIDSSYANNGIYKIDLVDAYILYSDINKIGRVLILRQENSDLYIYQVDEFGNEDEGFGSQGSKIRNLSNYPARCFTKFINDSVFFISFHVKDSLNDHLILRKYHIKGNVDTTSFQKDLTFELNNSLIEVKDIHIYNDQKLLLTGNIIREGKYSFILIKLNPNGTLDTGFNSIGYKIDSFGLGESKFVNFSIDINQEFIISGTSNVQGESRLCLAKYKYNGSDDIDFGVNGKFILQSNLNAENHSIQRLAFNEIMIITNTRLPINSKVVGIPLIYDEVVDSNSIGKKFLGIHCGYINADDGLVKCTVDNKIVVASNGFGNVMVMRKLYNGEKDPDFAGGSEFVSLQDISFSLNSMLVQNDSKIILAGRAINNTEIVIVRLNKDGTLDNTFGDKGIIREKYTDVYNIKIEFFEDSSIILGGTKYEKPDIYLLLINYDKFGKLRLPFGGRYIYYLDFVDLLDLKVTKDFKILVSSYTNKNEFGSTFKLTLLSRYTNSGSLDLTFDGRGLFRTDIIPVEYEKNPIVLQENGSALLYTHAKTNASLIKYKENGSRDWSYGPAFMEQIAGNKNVKNYNLSIDKYQKTIAIFSIKNTGGPSYIVKLDQDGNLDHTFSATGLVEIKQFVGDREIQSSDIDMNNKIVIMGTGSTGDSPSTKIMRFNNTEFVNVDNVPEKNSLLKIFPNPIRENFNIVNILEKKVRVELLDMCGKVLNSLELQPGNNYYNWRDLSPGVYLIKTSNRSYRIIKL